MKTMMRFVTISLGAVLAFSGVADALTMGTGNFKIKLEDFEQFLPGLSNFGTPNAPGNVAGFYNDGTEDLRGIVNITQMAWTSGTVANYDVMALNGVNSGTDSLVGVFYGLDANYAQGSPTAMAFGFTGGHLDLYLDTTPDEDVTAGPGGFGPSSAYATVTNGDATLWLSMDFVPGDDPNAPGVSTLAGTANLTGFPSGGIDGQVGQAFLDITGGSAAHLFDKDVFGLGRDIIFGNHFGGPGNTNFVPQDFTWGWDLASDDPARGATIPEPGTVVLLGMGLIALGGAARRRMI